MFDTMPELPEVETIKRGLSSFLKGKKIKEVEILRPKMIGNVSPAAFKRKLIGDKVLGIKRHAKYLMVSLKSGNVLLFHLGMTGVLLKTRKGNPLSKTGREARKYIRIRFLFTDGTKLEFSDLRLFGKVWLFPENKVYEMERIKRLGPEPFSKEFTPEWFYEQLKKKKTKIKMLLLDQSFFVGMGNIYVNEALFRVGIHPARPADKITKHEAFRLHKAIIDILRSAIKHGGSSVDNYVGVDGEEGSFGKLHRVYGRKGEPCFKCKTNIQRISLGQRGTFFCVKCQK